MTFIVEILPLEFTVKQEHFTGKVREFGGPTVLRQEILVDFQIAEPLKNVLRFLLISHSGSA